MAKKCDIISTFVPFEINNKKLLNAIVVEMEQCAVNETFYARTQKLLADIERYVADLSFDLQVDGVCTKLTPSSLLKGCGIELWDDYDDLCEKIVDYMELMREFKGVKLFITVNMRNYFEDDVVQQFCNTALKHKLTILMIEATTYPLLSGEKRITIDKDMCIF